MAQKESITIVGAGLAGALLACTLARRGYHVSVFERRPDPRESGFIGGRSINLALSTRGIAALERVGLAEKVLADAVPMPGRMMHSVAGELTFQPYSKNPDDAINSVSRGGLNIALLDAAERLDGVLLHFGHRCVDLDLDRPSVTFEDEQGGRVTHVGDLVIGADGAFSAVRGALQKIDRFDFSQHYLEHGYKELTIPPTADGEFAMEPHALHIWPRGGYMMIALPNQDRSFTCTAFLPFDGPNGFGSMRSVTDVEPWFRQRFPDAVPLLPKLIEDFMHNPLGSLVTVRCAPWHHRDKVLILGDAAHAIVPFYGQGMNAAFEDCAALDDFIDRHDGDWRELLPAFSRARKPHADAIADLALQNFIEMRDKVGSRAFLLKKKGEQTLHKLLPGWYRPLYNMVTFSRIPYAEAREIARRQGAIVRGAALGIVLIVLLLLLGLLLVLL